MEERPLTAQDLKFVHWYRKYRDIYQAAERAKIPKNSAKKTFSRPDIRDEIERQDLVVEQERARVQVQAEGITRDMLDAELFSLIKLNPRTHSAAKHRAIELGYVRAGVMQGTMKSIDLTPPSSDDEAPLPSIYQAIFSGAVQISSAAAPLLPSATASSPITAASPLPAPPPSQHPAQQPQTPSATVPATPAPARARRMTVG